MPLRDRQRKRKTKPMTTAGAIVEAVSVVVVWVNGVTTTVVDVDVK